MLHTRRGRGLLLLAARHARLEDLFAVGLEKSLSVHRSLDLAGPLVLRQLRIALQEAACCVGQLNSNGLLTETPAPRAFAFRPPRLDVREEVLGPHGVGAPEVADQRHHLGGDFEHRAQQGLQDGLHE